MNWKEITASMSNLREKVPVTWDEVKRDSVLLADKIQKEFDKLPTRILAITRGGLIPAALVTRSLGIKDIETIGLESYDDEQGQDDKIAVLKKANPDYLENTLVIDDLVDSGKTLEFLRTLTKDCIFATLYAKPVGEPYTDVFVRLFDQDVWVDFPWEV